MKTELGFGGILGGGGGGDRRQAGLNLTLPVPFNPGSRPVFVGCRLFSFFLIAKYCTLLRNFPFSPPPATLGIPLPAPLHYLILINFGGYSAKNLTKRASLLSLFLGDFRENKGLRL